MSKHKSDLGVDFLKRVSVFSSFSDEVLYQIYRIGEVLNFETDSHIMVEGENSAGIYFVLEGSLHVYKSAAGGIEKGVRVGTLNEGSVIGEISLIDRQPRSATVVAASPVMLFSLEADQWNDFLKKNPDIEIEFLRKIALVLASRIRDLDRDLIMAHKLLWELRVRRQESADSPSVSSSNS